MTVVAAATAVLALSPTAVAQQAPLGTPQEASAMLDKAVAAVKADQAVALAMFNKGESGFIATSIHAASESRTGDSSPVRVLFRPARM